MAKDKIENYKDSRGEFRWTATSANGRIIGASTEGYKNHVDLIDNAAQLGAALTEWAQQQRTLAAGPKKATTKKPVKKATTKKPVKKATTKKPVKKVLRKKPRG